MSLDADKRKAEAVILDIILCQDGFWPRKTTLWKAFWLAHLLTMKEGGFSLSEHPIIRLPQGPGPEDGNELLARLEDACLLKSRSDGDAFEYNPISFRVPESRLPDARRFVELWLNREERKAIQKASVTFFGMTSRDASEWSHSYSAAWERAGTNGREMNIYLDLLGPEEETVDQKMKRIDEAKELMDDFGSKLRNAFDD